MQVALPMGSVYLHGACLSLQEKQASEIENGNYINYIHKIFGRHKCDISIDNAMEVNVVQ